MKRSIVLPKNIAVGLHGRPESPCNKKNRGGRPLRSTATFAESRPRVLVPPGPYVCLRSGRAQERLLRAAQDATKRTSQPQSEDAMSTDNHAKTRTERDSMGEMQVPVDALYGASTQRAVLNFPISDLRYPRRFIKALGQVKLAAAKTNAELGLVDKGIADAIAAAAQEVVDGKADQHFVVDIFQTGSGTS